MKKLIMMSALALGLAACAEQEAAEETTTDVVEEPMATDMGAMGNEEGDRGGEDDRTIIGDEAAMDGADDAAAADDAM